MYDLERCECDVFDLCLIERCSANPYEAQCDIVDLTREGGVSGPEEPDYGKAERPQG